MNEDAEKQKQLEISLFIDIAVWEDKYREKHTKGKTDEELEKEGWWKDTSGEWYSLKLGKALERKFKKRLHEIILDRVGISKVKSVIK